MLAGRVAWLSVSRATWQYRQSPRRFQAKGLDESTPYSPGASGRCRHITSESEASAGLSDVAGAFPLLRFVASAHGQLGSAR